jgi:hypothetical protein
MKDRDQLAIFESYREDILNKFKQSLEGDKEEETSFEPEKQEELNDVPEIQSDNTDSDDVDFDADIEDSDDVEDIEPPKKKNVIVRSHEISRNIGPKLREIVRHMSDVIEDVDIFEEIKNAIKIANEDLEDENMITDTPLSIYDDLIAAGVYSEEERDSDDIEDKETEVLQGFDDDYSDDDDVSGESEFNLSKKTRKEREDFRSGMRKDVERSKAEDILRDLGVDFGPEREDY